MALDLQQRHQLDTVSVSGMDVSRVFTSHALYGDNIRVPSSFHILPDFRPMSAQARADALHGIAPYTAGGHRFDPLLGPHTNETLWLTPWAQSLDFLRDIRAASIGGTDLSRAWINGWLSAKLRHSEKSKTLFSQNLGVSSKTDRLIWRSRRVLNCLSHVLPVLTTMPSTTRSLFWQTLLDDIAKIGAPTDTVWSSLTDGFHPLSPRAIWLRAIALLGVEAALPGLLQSDLVEKSLVQINASIQNDGLINGGSIVGTLSAGADLCMLGRIPQVEPILHVVRNALASLRHRDGTLVTFGVGAADYAHLLDAVLGPGNSKPSVLLVGSGITRASVDNSVIWLRAPQNDQAWGPLCEIDVAGGSLLTNFGDANSGVLFHGPIAEIQARSRRRDEPDFILLEATGALCVQGKTYSFLRHIKTSLDGSRIEGEDFITSESDVLDGAIKQISFAIPETSACHFSNDKQSVLIVTSKQQAWRFRIQGMDIPIEIASVTPQRNAPLVERFVIICRRSDAPNRSDFRATWQLVLEDLE